MQYEFTNAFIRDVKKSPPEVQAQIRKLIEELRSIDRLDELQNIKKMKGFAQAFRIRLGEYRVGILLDKDRIVLVRMLHRKEIYRYFP